MPSFLRTQGLSGITGTVTDSSGAVVTEAAATATNNAKGVASRTVTNATGDYVLGDVASGVYTLRVEKPGFETRIVMGVYVDVSRTATANTELKLGAAEPIFQAIIPAFVSSKVSCYLARLVRGAVRPVST